MDLCIKTTKTLADFFPKNHVKFEIMFPKLEFMVSIFKKWNHSTLVFTCLSTYHDNENPTWGITLGLFRDYQRAYIGYWVIEVT
jgi:hypothetical protein